MGRLVSLVAPILLATSAYIRAEPSTETLAPPADGLIVWLDASAQAQVRTGDDGRVLRWDSRALAILNATANAGSAPRLVMDAFGEGKPGLRFDGDAWMELPRLADSPGNLTVFVVFQRDDDHGGGPPWQRLISAHDGVSENDTKGGGVFLDTNGSPAPMTARVVTGSFGHAQRGPLTLGRNQRSTAERLRGDVAEVIIYDRGFLVDEQYAKVHDYLVAKWAIIEDPRDDWTRARPLGETPTRVSDVLPLSDQDNAGQWKRFSPLWDEFTGSRLKSRQWFDHNPNWYGRMPALFLPSNVAVADGSMHLTMRHDPSLPRVTKYGNSVYENFSSASVVGTGFVLYGYFEIEARAMDSAGSSAWWFASKMFNPQGQASRTEIDVFELGGKAAGHENQYHMNAHIFETPEDGEKKWNRGGTWKAPFNFADGFHVFGLEWTPEHIRFYVDGVLVRRMPNTHWHTPMRMIFDSETMTDWLGWPDPADLPSTFTVNYVRAWKNADTRVDWTQHWRPEHDDETEITRFVRDYE